MKTNRTSFFLPACPVSPGTGGGAGSGDEDQTTPHSSPQLSRWAAQVPPLPKEMERTIKIKKGADQLGEFFEMTRLVRGRREGKEADFSIDGKLFFILFFI